MYVLLMLLVALNHARKYHFQLGAFLRRKGPNSKSLLLEFFRIVGLWFHEPMLERSCNDLSAAIGKRCKNVFLHQVCNGCQISAHQIDHAVRWRRAGTIPGVNIFCMLPKLTSPPLSVVDRLILHATVAVQWPNSIYFRGIRCFINSV